jgi:hypothetical protein
MIWHSARESVHHEAVKAAVLKGAVAALLSQKTAVERPDDHSFRFVRKDERYDTVSRLKRIEGLWVFVFEKNDMLADSNKLVTSITF